MEFLNIIGIVLLVAMIPFALFMGIIAMAVLIWSWSRIGRYFINLGRWVGDWRNFVPLTVLGTVFLVVVVVLMLYLLPQLRIVWIVLLILQLVITIVCIMFAAIAWMFWFHQWFWPKYRRWLWSIISNLFAQRPVGQKTRPAVSGGRPRPVAGPTPGTERDGERRPPQKRSMLGSFWNLMLGKPQPKRQQARPVGVPQPGAAGVRPLREEAPVKRSWFGTFWALMLGKPQPKRQQPRPTRVRRTEETLGPSGDLAPTVGTDAGLSEMASSAADPGRKARPTKRSWFASFWALMLGKPSKARERKVQPLEAKTRDRGDRPNQTTAADSRTRATAPVTAAGGGAKAAKRGFGGGISNSIVRGGLWVVEKVRGGIEWIRVRLNLD